MLIGGKHYRVEKDKFEQLDKCMFEILVVLERNVDLEHKKLGFHQHEMSCKHLEWEWELDKEKLWIEDQMRQMVAC